MNDSALGAAGRRAARPERARPRLSGLLLCLLLASAFLPSRPAGAWEPWLPPGQGPAAPAEGKPHQLPGGPGRPPVAADGTAATLAEVRTRLARKIARLCRDGSPGLQGARLAGKAAPDTLRSVALLCDFADSLLYGRYGQVAGDFPPPRQSDFYYTAHDSLYYAHLLRDVSTYWQAVSGGRFTLSCDVVGAVVNLPHPMAYYGNDPQEGEQSILLAADVVAAADPLVDFSAYDTVLLIHAGAGEETDILDNSPEQIYSTYLGPEDFADAVAESILTIPYLPTADQPAGQGVSHVLVLPENEFQDPLGSFAGYFGSLGVYCFEVGLRLGMLSLSDFTPAGHPDSQGIGEFGLMGYGLFVGAGFIPDQPCPFNKMLMGWLTPYRIEPAALDSFLLTPAERTTTPRACARVEITGQEYWLLEYRLQDPDGNAMFSFAGDLNGNGVPDFYDADSDSGDGRPTGYFDPATDQREWLTGAEWDFFMSENQARPDSMSNGLGYKGAGSGIYIWHVDEGVIQDVFGADRNLYNADPARKAVDVEEADAIQDLDSSFPSAYYLGSDGDSFRGEDQAEFGPGTIPSTETAGGAPTGIMIDRISNVVADSTAGPPLHIAYVETMTFHCFRGAPAGQPRELARLLLPDVDLRGSHLLAIDLDLPPDGVQEIVVAGHAGEV
jgi:hypothetical protein